MRDEVLERVGNGDEKSSGGTITVGESDKHDCISMSESSSIELFNDELQS